MLINRVSRDMIYWVVNEYAKMWYLEVVEGEDSGEGLRVVLG